MSDTTDTKWLTQEAYDRINAELERSYEVRLQSFYARHGGVGCRARERVGKAVPLPAGRGFL